METSHNIIFKDSRSMSSIPDGGADLVVTSPPYPMIKMWDKLFTDQDPEIEKSLSNGRGVEAFEAMNRLLDPVWEETFRILRPGGFACINIGDATRTLGGKFMLYPSHSRILSKLIEIGFTSLPAILWRKQTNAPNKFMGSGMLPAGAYVTLEHEYILIVRKGDKRSFAARGQNLLRKESALFWEERNTWFSDVWSDLKGVRQILPESKARKRSAAYPFELPYRLINMYSAKGDTVVDPFLGLGTTTLAAMATGRNSVGFELENGFSEIIQDRSKELVNFSCELIEKRVEDHKRFMEEREKEKGAAKHINIHYGFPVITAQEKQLFLNIPETIEETGKGSFKVTYSKTPKAAEEASPPKKSVKKAKKAPRSKKKKDTPDAKKPGKEYQQLSLFD